MNKIPFLKGSRINLRPLTEKDISGSYKNWFNDPEVIKYNSHGRFPMTYYKLVDFVKSTQTSTSQIVLAIEDNKTNKHIGNVSLQRINWIDRNAEIAFILGEKEYWGKGIMTEAGNLLISHGFNELNLHRIYCGTSSANVGMQKLATKIGMKQEGVRKDALFKQGKYHDIIEFGIVHIR